MLVTFIAAADGAARGLWTDTVGLLFTWAVLLPAIVTVCIVVAMVSGRGDKRDDDEIRSRWARKRPPSA
jgi:hypothetical protein